MDPDPRVRRRAQCLVVLCVSESQRQAARLAHVDAKTLRRWSQRYVAEGRDGLADRPRPGRPRKLNGKAEAFIQRLLDELPTEHGYVTATWTLADLQDLLARNGWLVALTTLDRALHWMGYRYRRPRHDLDHRQDADAVASVKQTLAVLQKKGVITQAEYDSCISMSAICTPIPTWQKCVSDAAFPTPSRQPVSTRRSPSLEPLSIARDA